MQDLQPQPLSHEILTSYEPLTDDRLGNLLASIGNHEGKALLLLAMQPGALYGYSDLHRLLTERVGDNLSNPINQSSPMAWCKKSLEPVGMVARAEQGSQLRFGITEDGIHYGKPLAESLLGLSDRRNISLEAIWGVTVSRTNERSPYARYKIIQTLMAANKSLSPMELVNSSGIEPTRLQIQLESMRRAELLEYNEWNHSQQDPVYRLIRSDFEPQSARMRKSTLQAIDYLRNHTSATLSEIEDFCWVSMTEEEKETISRKQLRTRLNTSLNGLVDATVMVKEGTVRGDSVYLTDAQKELWQELLSILESSRMAGAKDSKTTESFLDSPPRVRRALHRAYESTARGANALGLEVGGMVLHLLEVDGTLSVRDMTEKISQMGRKVSTMGVRQIVRQFVKQGVVDESKTKVKMYSRRSDLHS